MEASPEPARAAVEQGLRLAQRASEKVREQVERVVGYVHHLLVDAERQRWVAVAHQIARRGLTSFALGRRKRTAAVALFPRMRLSNLVPGTALVALALLAPSTSLAQIDPGLSVAAGNSWETRQMSQVSCAGAACQLSATVDPMAPVTFAPLAPTTSP